MKITHNAVPEQEGLSAVVLSTKLGWLASCQFFQRSLPVKRFFFSLPTVVKSLLTLGVSSYYCTVFILQYKVPWGGLLRELVL